MDLRVTIVGCLLMAAVPNAPAAGRPSQQVGRLLEGEQLFKGYCAPCHGRTGKGDGPVVQALKTVPADLTLIAQRNGGTFSREEVARSIEEGTPTLWAHGSKDMPVWGPIFSSLALGSYKPMNPRVEDVVTFLESIQSRDGATPK
jgi:mono/diheme cytochrome c family protein